MKLEDSALVKGCRETGIITDLGYRHLDFIRGMRNYASAAHPNQNELTGLQLAAWLQTCIREVLGKEPGGPAIEVRKLLYNLRTQVLTPQDVPPIGSAIGHLPVDIARSLLRAISGMYTDPQLPANIRSNIRLIASEIWAVSGNEARYDAGLKQASLSANGDLPRAKAARDFLELVDGLAYLPTDALALELSLALDGLLMTHNELNNFHNEPTSARVLKALVPASGSIPDSVGAKYVKVLTMCSIGNGYGVSWGAEPIYDELISRWQDRQITVFVALVRDADVASRLDQSNCARYYQALASRLDSQATSPSLKQALGFLAGFPAVSLGKVANDVRLVDFLRQLGLRVR